MADRKDLTDKMIADILMQMWNLLAVAHMTDSIDLYGYKIHEITMALTLGLMEDGE